MKNLLRGAVAAVAIAGCLPGIRAVFTELEQRQGSDCGRVERGFRGQADTLGYVPLNVAGGVMTGRLITAPPGAATSGLNLSPGTTPANPANGDIWVTSAGLFVRVGGVTIGPLSGGTTSSFAAIAPLAVSFPGNIVTYGLNTDSTLTVLNGNLGYQSAEPEHVARTSDLLGGHFRSHLRSRDYGLVKKLRSREPLDDRQTARPVRSAVPVRSTASATSDHRRCHASHRQRVHARAVRCPQVCSASMRSAAPAQWR